MNMLIIGEKINASIEAVGKAILDRNVEFITELAKAQEAAGADFIDVNAGGEVSQGKESIKWLVETIQSVTQKPLSIDSDNPEVIKAGIEVYGERDLIVNSVSAEPERLYTVGPLAAERKAKVIALAMGAEGIPDNVEQRLEDCETIMDALTGMGIKEEQVYFDPLVMPVSVGPRNGIVTLQTIEEIKARFPNSKTVVGLSNISFGLPDRRLLNHSFLMLAFQAGLDAAIMDPLDRKLMSAVKIAMLFFQQGKVGSVLYPDSL